MSETTRRRFLEVTAAATAAAVIAPRAFAAPRAAPVYGVDAPLPAAPVGPSAPYGAYQSEIYISGMSAGVKPPFTTNLTDLEAAASGLLSPAAREHLLDEAGGAAAARANAEALDRWRIVPRMFIDRAQRDLRTTVLGQEMPAPIILGPVGGQRLAHSSGEVGSAQAAAGLSLTYVHASAASDSIEVVTAGAPSGARWFGLAWPEGAPDVTSLTRARLAGCTHLVLSPPQPGQSWAPLAAVREAWGGPVLLSGIQTAADAQQALRQGVEGIVVSNERGRRGAEPVGTIDALPSVVEAVGGKAPVLFGSGVRTGTDVFRALALGADAVVVSRPYVYGLRLGSGDGGVRHMLRTILAEFDITLGIAGVADYRKLGPDALVTAERAGRGPARKRRPKRRPRRR